MSDTGYKLLGRAVWRGGRLYARRRHRRRLWRRRLALGGLLGMLGAAAAIAAVRSRGVRSTD